MSRRTSRATSSLLGLFVSGLFVALWWSLVTPVSVRADPGPTGFQHLEALSSLISGFEGPGLDGWTGGVTDTVHVKEGSQSLKLTANDANPDGVYSQKDVSLDLRNNQVALWLYVDDVSNLKTLSLNFLDDGWTDFAHWGPDSALIDGWNRVIIQPELCSFDGSGIADWSNVTTLELQVRAHPSQTVSVSFDDLQLVPERLRGRMTLAFDDGYDSVHDLAYPRMEAKGYEGVAYVVENWVGTSGHMDLTKVYTLAGAGWDVGSHTVSHPDLTTLSGVTLTHELTASQQYLVDHNLGPGYRHLAYPFGRYDAAVAGAVAGYYHTGRRLTTSTWDDVQSDNTALPFSLPAGDPRLLDAFEVTSTLAVTDVIDVVSRTVAANGWGILLFHNVTDTVGGAYDYSLANFQTILDYLDDNDVPVVTVSDVYDWQGSVVQRTSGHGQDGWPEMALAQPFVVTIEDDFGQPVASVPVSFTVVAGGGALVEAQPVTTDSGGQAATTLVLGPDVGYNEVWATVVGPAGSPITFTATGLSRTVFLPIVIKGFP